MANTEAPPREVGARFYSTVLGRFLSADPLVASADGLTAAAILGLIESGGLSSFALTVATPLCQVYLYRVGNNCP